MNAPFVSLAELAHVSKSIVDPSKVEDQHVHLYSIPAFDKERRPERTDPAAIKSGKFRVPDGAVLLSRMNPHKHRVWLPKATGLLSLASTEFVVLVPNDRVLSAYLYYALRSKNVAYALRELVTGTTGSHQRVRIEDALAIEVRVPSAEEQQCIVARLSALESLESESRAAIRFLDSVFSAAFASCVNSNTAVRHPLTELAELTKGYSYKSEELRTSTSALVGLACMDRAGGFKLGGLKQIVASPRRAQIVAPGDICVAQTDITQAAEIIGRAIRIPEVRGYSSLIASLDLVIARPADGIESTYLFGIVSSGDFRSHCRSQANGTTVLHLPSSAIPEYPAPHVGPKAAKTFSEHWSPLLALRDELQRTAETCADAASVLLERELSHV